MTERPILFTGEMVRAILDGRKTQTRRVVRPQPLATLYNIDVRKWSARECAEYGCPYGQPGDLLYVRETWAVIEKRWEARGTYSEILGPLREYGDTEADDWHVLYRADGPSLYNGADDVQHGIERWRPSIHMPKWAARIWLEVTDVRVERVQEVSETDALAEGISRVPFRPDDGFPLCDGYMVGVDDGETPLHTSAANAFRELWDSINEARGYAWDTNPWVWVVSFREVRP